MSIETTTWLSSAPCPTFNSVRARRTAVGDRQIAVFRLSDGTLRATDAACPHNGGPSPTASPDLGVVVCLLHQYAFRFSDGGCCLGIGSVRTYQIADQGGQIVVVIDPG